MGNPRTQTIWSTRLFTNPGSFLCTLRPFVVFGNAGKLSFFLEFWVFSLSFEYIYWVLGGNLWNIWVFSLKTLFIWKKWVIFLPWEFDFAINCAFFKMYLLNFGPKMPENEDFCLSFELFSWVSDFLSFGVLEFFWGVHKKKPDLNIKRSPRLTLLRSWLKSLDKIKTPFSPLIQEKNMWRQNRVPTTELINETPWHHGDIVPLKDLQFAFFAISDYVLFWCC